MLLNKLRHARTYEWPGARQQFLKNDRQAVLIAIPADPPVKSFRRRINGRDAARQRSHHSCQVLYEPKIGNFDVVVHQEKVLRFDVEVLQLVLDIHHVESFGALFHVAQQFIARNSRQAGSSAIFEPVEEIAIGQLHNDDEPAFQNIVTLEGENERMTDGFDAAQSFQLLFCRCPSSSLEVKSP